MTKVLRLGPTLSVTNPEADVTQIDVKTGAARSRELVWFATEVDGPYGPAPVVVGPGETGESQHLRRLAISMAGYTQARIHVISAFPAPFCGDSSGARVELAFAADKSSPLTPISSTPCTAGFYDWDAPGDMVIATPWCDIDAAARALDSAWLGFIVLEASPAGPCDYSWHAFRLAVELR